MTTSATARPRSLRRSTCSTGKSSGSASVPELVTAIDDYVAHHNTDPKPFIWTKSARDILQKVIRANARLSSKQSEMLH